jgi:hypothetical protein
MRLKGTKPTDVEEQLQAVNYFRYRKLLSQIGQGSRFSTSRHMRLQLKKSRNANLETRFRNEWQVWKSPDRWEMDDPSQPLSD